MQGNQDIGTRGRDHSRFSSFQTRRSGYNSGYRMVAPAKGGEDELGETDHALQMERGEGGAEGGRLTDQTRNNGGGLAEVNDTGG